MNDRKPVNESSEEMEHSPKDCDGSENAFQDKCEESSRSPSIHGNQVSHPVPQNELGNEKLKEENESGLFQLGSSPTDISSSSNLKPASSSRNSTNESLRPCAEVKTQECSSSLNEKVHLDRNRSGSSTPSEPNIKSGEKPKNSSSTFSGMLPGLTYRDLFESKLSRALLPESHNCPLFHRHHSDSISGGASISRKRTELQMDLHPSLLDVNQGQPSTFSYQPVITDGSLAGDRLESPSSVAATGEATERTAESNTSTEKISKYASNAQRLLLTILQEMMELDEEHNLYKKFHKLFLGLTELSCREREAVLTSQLFLYLEQKKTAWYVQNMFVSRNETTEYLIQEAYEYLVSRVVFALASTVSERTSLEFKMIMDNYNSLKGLYERCSQFWSNNHKDIQDEDSRIRVLGLKRMTQRLFLQTRNAFRELLMHIGVHAEEKIINSFEKKLWEEDKSFLRRRF